MTFSIGAISQAQGKVLPWLGPLYQQIGRHVHSALALSIIETAKRLNLSTSALLREVCTAGVQGKAITTRLPLPENGTSKLPR